MNLFQISKSDTVVSKREIILPVHQQALAIETILKDFTKPELFNNDLPNSSYAVKAAMRRCDDHIQATFGYALIKAYVLEIIDFYCKWTSSYRTYNNYKGFITELRKYLNFNYSLKNYSDEEWGNAIDSDDCLRSVLNQIKDPIKTYINERDGWCILFTNMQHGNLIIEDHGDYRIHQWEMKDGIKFRKQHKLRPAGGVLC